MKDTGLIVTLLKRKRLRGPVSDLPGAERSRQYEASQYDLTL